MMRVTYSDEGSSFRPTISTSEFIANYWATLTYGQFGFGINTPRTSSGEPIIPTISAPGGNSYYFEGLILACLDANAEAIWRAAGSLTKNGIRWIPSLLLIQRYAVQASAWFRGDSISGPEIRRQIGGQEYEVGDVTHIPYDLTLITNNDNPAIPTGLTVRRFLGTLCHEYSHNFLEFWDLYGPQGWYGLLGLAWRLYTSRKYV